MTEAKIADDAVLAAHIADDAVLSAHIGLQCISDGGTLEDTLWVTTKCTVVLF